MGRNRLRPRPERACIFYQFNNPLEYSPGISLGQKSLIPFFRKEGGKNTVIIFIPLAGNRNTDGSFNNLTSNTNFWSSLQSSSSNAWNRNLNSGNATVNRNTNDKANGFSVRCLKNWFKTNAHFCEHLF